MFGLGPHKTYYAYSQAAWWTSFMTIFLQRSEPIQVTWYTRFRKWNDKETKEVDKELHRLLKSLFVTVFRLTLGVGMSPVWFAIITCGEVRWGAPRLANTLHLFDFHWHLCCAFNSAENEWFLIVRRGLCQFFYTSKIHSFFLIFLIFLVKFWPFNILHEPGSWLSWQIPHLFLVW